MDSCPISELIIVHDSGLPAFAWLNPLKKDIATGVANPESRDLMSGLFTAILTMSEDISETAAIKSIKMLRTTFKYAIKEKLVFILGYDSNASVVQEPLVDSFLSDIINDFSKQYADYITDDMLLDGDIFSGFSSYMENGITDTRWKIERTEQEVLDNILELLLDIVGPIGTQMFKSNLRKQIQYRKKRRADLPQLAKDLVYEMSLLMDPAQAKQIGDEIKSIIRAR
ncbi:MAG: hypothetical protein ACXADY_04715 [Candidatus Hodarchaeales archaeon]|jgi:hypothetical protein